MKRVAFRLPQPSGSYDIGLVEAMRISACSLWAHDPSSVLHAAARLYIYMYIYTRLRTGFCAGFREKLLSYEFAEKSF